MKLCFRTKSLKKTMRRLNQIERYGFLCQVADALWSCFFFLLDVSIRMQVKFQSRSDWISNCCLDIRAASQSCLYKFNYFWYFSYCLLVLIKLFEEVLKLLVKTVQVNFVVKTLLYYYCVYYEIYLNSL